MAVLSLGKVQEGPVHLHPSLRRGWRGPEGLCLCPTHSLGLSVGLCSGDPTLADGTQEHALTQECTQTAFAACLCRDVRVSPGMSAGAFPLQTVPGDSLGLF